MKNCNVVGAVIYLEELQNTLLSNKNYKAATLLNGVINDIALARSEITTKASLAGAMTVDIYGNLGKVVTAPPKPTSSASNDSANTSSGIDYTNYAKELIGLVKNHKKVSIKLSVSKAVAALKGVGNGYTLHDKGVITYPDFRGFTENKPAVTNVAKHFKISNEEAVTLAEEQYVGFHLQMAKVYEHIHVGVVDFMQNNLKDPKTRYINNLYSKLLKMADKDLVLNGIQEGYWKTNVDEFIAVALNNPAMFSYLSNMKVSNNKYVMHKMIKTLAGMVGISLDSEGAAVLDMFVQMVDVKSKNTNALTTVVINNPKSGNKHNKEHIDRKEKLDKYDEANPYHSAKSVYNNNEELKQVGTFKEYLNYVSSIFPLSKVTKVLYHGTGRKFDAFSSDYLGETTGSEGYKDGTVQDSMNATFFSDVKGNTDQYTIIERQEVLGDIYGILVNILDYLPMSGSSEKKGSSRVVKQINLLYTKHPDLALELKEVYVDANVTPKDFRNKIREEARIADEAKKKYGKSTTINQIGSFSRAIAGFEYLIDNIQSMRTDGYRVNPADDTISFYTASNPYSIIRITEDGSIVGKASLSKHVGRNITDLKLEEFDSFVVEGLNEVKKLQAELFSGLTDAGFNPTTYQVVVNVQDATVYDFVGRTFVYNVGDDIDVSHVASKYTEKAINDGQDAVIYKDIKDPQLATNYGVFDTSNIHILGNSKDAAMFSEYKKTGVVVSPSTTKPVTRADSIYNGSVGNSTDLHAAPLIHYAFKHVGTAEQNNINDLFNKCKKG